MNDTFDREYIAKHSTAHWHPVRPMTLKRMALEMAETLTMPLFEQIPFKSTDEPQLAYKPEYKLPPIQISEPCIVIPLIREYRIRQCDLVRMPVKEFRRFMKFVRHGWIMVPDADGILHPRKVARIIESVNCPETVVKYYD